MFYCLCCFSAGKLRVQIGIGTISVVAVLSACEMSYCSINGKLHHGCSCTMGLHSLQHLWVRLCFKSQSLTPKSQSTVLYPLYRPGNKRKGAQRLNSQSFFDCNICEPKITLGVITSCWTTITGSISHPQQDRAREKTEGERQEWF